MTGAICRAKNPNPDFVLNYPRYKGASVFWSRVRISAADRAANMRRGRFSITAFA